MSGADVEVYLSQVHDGSVSSGFRALYEERLLLDVTLLIEEHHFQVNCWLQAWCYRGGQSIHILSGGCRCRANLIVNNLNTLVTWGSWYNMGLHSKSMQYTRMALSGHSTKHVERQCV